MNPTDGRRHSATGSSSIQDPSLGRGEGEGGKKGGREEGTLKAQAQAFSLSHSLFPAGSIARSFSTLVSMAWEILRKHLRIAWQGQNVRNGRKFNFAPQEQPPVSRNTTTVTTAFDNTGTVAQDRGLDWQH